MYINILKVWYLNIINKKNASSLSPANYTVPKTAAAEWQHWAVEKGNPWPDARQSPQQYIRNWCMQSVASTPSAPNVSRLDSYRNETIRCRQITVLQTPTVLRQRRLVQKQPSFNVARGASMSGHVKSHTRHRPFDQGDKVNPSGRLLSTRKSEGGSRRQGTFAEVRARLIRSLMALWRGSRLADLRQLRP